MTSDIRSILQRITAIEEGATITPAVVKHGLNPQQKSVPQLPALFKPKKIKALGAKTDPQHPMKGYAVGADESVESTKSALEEAMAKVEEDMLGKVKADLNSYLDRLEKKMAGDDGQREKGTPDLDRLEKKTRVDRDLIDKAVSAVEKGQAEEQQVAEDPTEQDLMTAPPPAPIEDPVLPESMGPVFTMEMSDGTCLECWGDEGRGFEIRREGRAMPSRFPKADHAKMAMDLFRNRWEREDRGQDYIEER
jgi:hypothetical protein